MGRNDRQFLESCFIKTLENLVKEREREGRLLKKELSSHLKNIRRITNKVEILAKKQPEQMKKKLKERLKELGHEIQLSDEKITSEAAYFAQRYDLTEEIARLNCHLEHFDELLLSARTDPVGKTMDFPTQELFRESNTINSKAQDIRIIKYGLALKGEVESIRQQVQNLE